MLGVTWLLFLPFSYGIIRKINVGEKIQNYIRSGNNIVTIISNKAISKFLIDFKISQGIRVDSFSSIIPGCIG